MSDDARDPRAVVGARVKWRGLEAKVDGHQVNGQVRIRGDIVSGRVAVRELEFPDPAPGTLPVVLLHPDARLPTRSHEGDAGLDLWPLGDVSLPSGFGAKVRTGIAVGIPPGHVGLVCGRSGLGAKGVDVHAGVIDPGFTGEVEVILYNHGRSEVFPADKAVAQMLVIEVAKLTPVQVAALPESARGSAGFGSSDRPAPGGGEGVAP